MDPDTQLVSAVESGDCNLATLALEQGADIETRVVGGRSLLIPAATSRGPEYPHEEMLNLLVDHGINIDARDNCYATPLHRVIDYCFMDISLAPFHRVIRLEPDFNVLDNWGFTPVATAFRGLANKINFHESANLNHMLKEVTESFLLHGGNIDAGFTPVMYAAQHGWTKYLQRFIRHSQDIDATFFAGRTALHLAAANGYLSCIRLLLSAGASPYIVDSIGATPLQLATAQAHNLYCLYGQARSNPSVNRDYPAAVRLLQTAGQIG